MKQCKALYLVAAISLPLTMVSTRALSLEYHYEPWKLIDLQSVDGSFAHIVSKNPPDNTLFPVAPFVGQRVTQFVDYELNPIATFLAPTVTVTYREGEYIRDTGFVPKTIDPHRVSLDRNLTWTFNGTQWGEPSVNVLNLVNFQPRYWTRSVTVVPEPSMAVLLGLGVFLITIVRAFKTRW